jgi:hypothetical protein
MNAAPHESRTKVSPIAVPLRPGANVNVLTALAKFGHPFQSSAKSGEVWCWRNIPPEYRRSTPPCSQVIGAPLSPPRGQRGFPPPRGTPLPADERGGDGGAREELAAPQKLRG